MHWTNNTFTHKKSSVLCDLGYVSLARKARTIRRVLVVIISMKIMLRSRQFFLCSSLWVFRSKWYVSILSPKKKLFNASFRQKWIWYMAKWSIKFGNQSNHPNHYNHEWTPWYSRLNASIVKMMKQNLSGKLYRKTLTRYYFQWRLILGEHAARRFFRSRAD